MWGHRHRCNREHARSLWQPKCCVKWQGVFPSGDVAHLKFVTLAFRFHLPDGKCGLNLIFGIPEKSFLVLIVRWRHSLLLFCSPGIKTLFKVLKLMDVLCGSRWLFHAYHSLIRIPQPSVLTWVSSSLTGNARANSSGAVRPDLPYRFRGCPVATNSRAPDVTAVLSGLNSSMPSAVEAQPRLPGLCKRSATRQAGGCVLRGCHQKLSPGLCTGFRQSCLLWCNSYVKKMK